MGQLSFWSADARPRALGDLEGLLCGPGRAELFGRGSLARLIVVLGPPPEPEPEQDDEDTTPTPAPSTRSPMQALRPRLRPTPGSPHRSPARHAEPVAPETEDHDPAPDVDLDDLAFLDLDPDELAARLGHAPASQATRTRSRLEKADFLTLNASMDPTLAPTHPTPP